MSKTKKLSSLIAMAVLAGSVAGGGTAWASGDILIGSTGATTYDGGTNPYSSTSYVGVDGTESDIGDKVKSIRTVDGGVTENEKLHGIYLEKGYINVNSIADGIDVRSTGTQNVWGIGLNSTAIVKELGAEICGVSSIFAASSGAGLAYGIDSQGSKNAQAPFSSKIEFVKAVR